MLLHQKEVARSLLLFKRMDTSNPTSYWIKLKDLHTISDRIAWHPLFGVEPTPAGLEPAVLTVILRGMAPVDGFEPPNHGSEPCVLPLD